MFPWESFNPNDHEHPLNKIPQLCREFYDHGWTTGTGGGISIKHNGCIFATPSSVQKEKMKPQDLYILDLKGEPVYRPEFKLSQCMPLFFNCFDLGASCCIHTHSQNAVMISILNDFEFKVDGLGFVSDTVIPIIPNKLQEMDLKDSMAEKLTLYPKSYALIVKRHGIFVWADSWKAAVNLHNLLDNAFDIWLKLYLTDKTQLGRKGISNVLKTQ
jgi:methylthioribulose-1-phosphate dehydratase